MRWDMIPVKDVIRDDAKCLDMEAGSGIRPAFYSKKSMKNYKIKIYHVITAIKSTFNHLIKKRINSSSKGKFINDIFS